jgi:hypothetical protein
MIVYTETIDWKKTLDKPNNFGLFFLGILLSCQIVYIDFEHIVRWYLEFSTSYIPKVLDRA